MNSLFFNLLNKNINDTQNINNDCHDCDDCDECLISYLPLEHDFVTLYCGHSFNYKYIFNEVYNQKYNKPSTEVQILYKYQIKCPYCREIQNGLLPPNNKFISTELVNYPVRHCMKTKNCSYIFKSGKKKNIVCNKKCYEKFCGTHIKYQNKPKILCKHILLRGKNKGNNCSKPGIHDGFCKIHKPNN